MLVEENPQRENLMKYGSILVIDDEAKTYNSISVVFEELKILWASSGQEAMRILSKSNEIDLIILDIHLAGENGTDILAKIKEQHPHCKIMMLTAYANKENLMRSLRGRADEFVEKPFDPEDLRVKVNKLLESTTVKGIADVDHQALQRVIQYVHRNYVHDIPLEEVAQKVDLTPKYISRIFKDRVGKTFTEYRLGLRMEAAKEMLLSSNDSISEISDRLGYDNPESFMKIFKKITHQTPTEFRSRPKVVSKS